MHDGTNVRRTLPSLGRSVPRRRLIEAFLRDTPREVFLVAPSGYGKTVLASQLASSVRFQETLWIDAGGQELRGHELIEFVSAQLGIVGKGKGQSDMLLPEPSAALAEDSFARSLDQYWGRATCLVLDNLGRVDDWAAVSRLREVLSRTISSDHCLIVSSRRMEEASRGAGGAWLLEADDLRLTQQEGEELARELYGSDMNPTTVRELLSACSGHAAVYVVLARHHRLRLGLGAASSAPVAHLRQELQYLAKAHLDSLQQRGLVAASLLSSGVARHVEILLGVPFLDSDLRRISECIPLVRLESNNMGVLEFSVHDLARSLFGKGEGLGQSDLDQLVKRALESLAAKGEYSRLFELALSHPEAADLPALLEQHGSRLLDGGGFGLLQRALDAILVEVFVRRPALLLLQAQVEQHVGNVREAASKARIAAELARYSADEGTVVGASLFLGRVLLACGDAVGARRILQSFEHDSTLTLDVDTRVLACAYLGLASTHLGDAAGAEHSLEEARLIEEAEPSVSTRAKAHRDDINGFYCCAFRGDYARGLSFFSWQMRSADCPIDTRLPSMGNAALALCYRGYLRAALELIDEALALADQYSTVAWWQDLMGSRASILAGLGDYAAAERDGNAAIESARDECEAHYLRAEQSAWRRAGGDVEGAFSDSEAAHDFLGSVAMVHGRWLAEAELAANLLALGDGAAAVAHADAVLQSAGEIASRYSLGARLVLGERARGLGDPVEALRLFSPSVEYILSGNGNWTTAMNIRAFPGLLGIVAAAVGAERIPAHLLRMILPDNAEKALPMARDVLSEDEWRVLAKRLLGEDEFEKSAAEPELPAQCRVRLFGGLAVEIGGERIADAAWRKRKARLLFAMLVVRKGRDVPREQLLEYLWPEMDAQRAIANFYVVWNNMKNALCPGLPKGQTLPYARTAGGVCRLDDILVTSDLDEFERSLSEIRRAEASGDKEEVVRAAQRLGEVYRGDLLPGDIYDDWFAPLRERCRQEFGDGMLRAARALETDGDHVGALAMVRMALSHDAWREDLYQAALRCQIAVGQRSAAIDTYMACMHKLSEDLGLDPSVETRRLYERVLAMELPAEDGYSA